jgi:hypothetical protein
MANQRKAIDEPDPEETDEDDEDEEDDDDDSDERSAEKIEEEERVQLLQSLYDQDTLTVDQAMILEPLETSQENDDALELLESTQKASSSPAESSTHRQEFILMHLTKLGP